MEKIIYEEKSYRILFPVYFKIYSNRVEASVWPFRYTIKFSDIEDVRIIDRIPLYIGWGLRLHPWSKKLFFVTHHGKSVEIVKKKGFWKKIILSVKDPETFIKHLKKLLHS